MPNDLREPCRLAVAEAVATRATKPSLRRWLYHLAMVDVIPFLARFTNNDLCHTTLFQLLPLSGLFISRLLDVLDAPDGQRPPGHHTLALTLALAPPPWAGVRRVLLMVAS